MAHHQKPEINLAAAADAEDFGVLAVSRSRTSQSAKLTHSLAALRSLLGELKLAGATTHPVKVGKSSLRLRVKGKQQTLVLQD